MNPSEIIAEVANLGVVLRVEGTNLVHRGPRGALRPELIAKLKAHKPAIVAELTSAEVPRAPCPADVAERSAIIAEGDGCDRNIADRRALGEAGYGSWQAFVNAQQADIGAALDRLPVPCGRGGARLLEATRHFIVSPQFDEAIRCGWSLKRMFGLDTFVSLDEAAWGLSVGLALAPRNSDKIISIDEEAAVIRYKSANCWHRRIERRFRPPVDAVVWWECEEITNGAGHREEQQRDRTEVREKYVHAFDDEELLWL